MAEFISGMKMGDRIADFLKKNNKYNPKNYKDCYAYCKKNCMQLSNGKTGRAARYLYDAKDVTKYMTVWYDNNTI